MSICKTSVCRYLLREHFGDLAEVVGSVLLKKGACHLRQISTETGIGLEKVRKVLTVLIQQNLVLFEKNKRGLTEYWINTDTVLWRNRNPRYIHCAKSLYGDAAELVIEELLHHGQVTMTTVVDSVTDKLNEALEIAGHQKIGTSVVYEKFKCLANTHFIQQCPNPLECVQEEPQEDTTKLYTVPSLSHLNAGEGDKKRKRSLDSDDEPSSKKQKTENGKGSGDSIYWRINHQRFHQYFRDQMLIKAITNKLDKLEWILSDPDLTEFTRAEYTITDQVTVRAGGILQTMLRLSEVKSEDLAFTSSPMSFTEILQAVPRELGITKHLCEQYISMMTDDSTEFVTKIGESGGGMYIINVMKALSTLCQAHIESVVQERFGSKSLRIFRVLLLKKHLEQKQIEEMAMIPSKETKELLYNMFAQDFVTITEISKTPDHAPARTYYLFRVNIQQLARALLEHSFKALSNALMKREVETRENRRLMEKQERVDAIVAQSGADDEQKEEILQTITPAEKTQLTKVKHMLNMLEHSELELDETIFTLETYLHYYSEKQRQKL